MDNFLWSTCVVLQSYIAMSRLPRRDDQYSTILSGLCAGQYAAWALVRTSRTSRHVVAASFSLTSLHNPRTLDEAIAPRLIACRHSGVTQVLSLSTVRGDWAIGDKPYTVSHSGLANPIASFVIDLKGSVCAPTGALLRDFLDAEEEGGVLRWPPQVGGKNIQYFWIAASRKELRCHANISGERVAKIEWASPVKHVALTSRNGMQSVYIRFLMSHLTCLYSRFKSDGSIHSGPTYRSIFTAQA
jgi:hypothetical protein